MNKEYCEEFSGRIKRIMAKKQIRQTDIANELNISQCSVSGWVSGQSLPKSDRLVQLADMLGVSVEYLCTGKRSEKEKIQERIAYYKKMELISPAIENFFLGIIDEAT